MNKPLLLPILFIFFINIAYASNMLEISDLSITYNSETHRITTDGKTYGEFIQPGDSIDLDIELTNNFKTNDDINDVEITATIYNITEGNDIVEREDKFDLNDGSTKSKSISFDIPSDPEEVQKTLFITVKGTDDDGVVYNLNRTIYLNIEDEDHDVYIYTSILNQTTIKCSEKAKLVIWLYNDGNFDESKVTLQAKNADLGLDKIYNDLDIDEGVKYSKVIDLGPYAAAKTGKYAIKLEVFYKDTHLDDVKTIDLFVNACLNNTVSNASIADITENIETDEGDSEEIVVTESEDNLNDNLTNENLPEFKPAAKSSNQSNIMLIFGLVLVSLIIIVIIAIQLIKRDEYF